MGSEGRVARGHENDRGNARLLSRHEVDGREWKAGEGNANHDEPMRSSKVDPNEAHEEDGGWKGGRTESMFVWSVPPRGGSRRTRR